MIRIEFSSEEIDRLYRESDHHPHPRVRQKANALYLKALNLPHQQICKITRVTNNTLVKYLREYQAGGFDKLQELRFRRPESDLMKYRDQLEQYFGEHPAASTNEARAKIEEQTRLKRSPSAVYRFLKNIGMRRYKVGSIPSKADPDKQEAFLKQKLEPRLEEMRAGRREIFFVDAAHFVLAPFLGFLWSWCRLFVPAPSGRKRFNVLGAIHATTHQLITVTNDSYINSASVCDLLRKLADLGFQAPITLVLDNARYQHAKIVYETAAALGIELLHLPPYSPNLNLIERLWKFVKKKCLYSRYYENFGLFNKSISECLEKVGTAEYKDELDTLLTLKFQTFKKAQSMTV